MSNTFEEKFAQKKRHRAIDITDVAIYIMTVVGNDASVYVLVKTKDFNQNVLVEYAQVAQKYYEMGYKKNNGTMAMKYILKNASKYGIEYKKGRGRL